MAQSTNFSNIFDDDINFKGLFEILNPENNLVLADDMMLSDAQGIILAGQRDLRAELSALPTTPLWGNPPSIWRRTAPSPLHHGGGHPPKAQDHRHPDHQPPAQKRHDRGHSLFRRQRGAEIRRVLQHGVHGADQRHPAQLPPSAGFPLQQYSQEIAELRTGPPPPSSSSKAPPCSGCGR